MNKLNNRTAILRYVAASPMVIAITLGTAHAAGSAQTGSSDTTGSGAPVLVAQATTPSTKADEGIEEVTVTARKVSENIQDVPISVSALSSEQIKQEHITRLNDVAFTVPGLSVTAGQSAVDAETFTIRGQNQTNALATVDSAVGVYVDGVYWARQYGLNADMLDTKDVQVLRGPQGTLFGRNTTGGAILIETNDPDLTAFSGHVEGSYGNYNYLQGTAILNAPIIDDVLGVRVAVQRTLQDGYEPLIDDPSKKDGSQNNLAAKGKVLWQLSDKLSLMVSANYWFADYNVATFNLADMPSTSPGPLDAGLTAVGIGPCFANIAACTATGAGILNEDIQKYSHSDTADSLIPNSQKEKTQTYGATFTYDTNFGGTFKLISGYRRIDLDSINDYAAAAPNVLAYFNAYEHLYQWSTEAQLTGKTLDDRLTYAGGVFLFQESGIDGSLFNPFQPLTYIGTGGLLEDTQYLGHIGNRSLGVYGQGTYDITDQLQFTGGLRWSSETKGVTVDNGYWSGGDIHQPGGTFTCETPTGCGSGLKTGDNNISYLADLDYKVTPDLMFYVKTARGYRSGGVNLREVAGVPDFNPNVFKPEQLTEYEGGMKSEFFDHRVRLNVDAYYDKVVDIQRTYIVPAIGNGTAATFEGNAGEADFAGFEAALDAKVWEVSDQGLTLNLSGSNVSPWYVSYDNPLTGFYQGHEHFDSIVNWQFNLGGTYDRTLSFGDFTFHAEYAWESGYSMSLLNYYVSGGKYINASNGEVYANPNDIIGQVNALQSPPSGVFNARAALNFDDDRYEVALWGRNILNNRDVIGASSIPDDNVADMRRPPAMYGFTVAANF